MGVTPRRFGADGLAGIDGPVVGQSCDSEVYDELPLATADLTTHSSGRAGYWLIAAERRVRAAQPAQPPVVR